MKNKEVKTILENVKIQFDETQAPEVHEALNIAIAKMSSPWVKTEYKMPTKYGLYLCVVKPHNSKNKIPYMVDIYKFGPCDEISVPEAAPNTCFHKWDDKYSICMKPDVIAWMPVPYYYMSERKNEEDGE